MNNKAGFTLVELVVVILILGILASVAAPSLFDQSAKASENSARATLSIVRDAIELYAADHAGDPPDDATEAAFLTDIMDYLRGSTFPVCPVGNQNNNIQVTNTVGGSQGWRYHNGEFFINSIATGASAVGFNTF